METTKKTTTILTFILLAVIIFTLWFFSQNKKTISEPTTETPQITITEVSGELFTGSYPVVMGDSALAKMVNEYVSQTVAEFKEAADRDIPTIKEEFGADVPSANYSLIITPEYKKSATTESVVLEVYNYTGGANGNSTHKTFTVDSQGKQILLSDIIRGDAKDAFTALVKKAILDWRVEGQEGPLAFAEDVEALTFDSFDKFALTDDALIVYFNKYDVTPGYVGAPSFALPLSEVGQYFVELM